MYPAQSKDSVCAASILQGSISRKIMIVLTAFLLVFAGAFACPVHAQIETVLHSFTGQDGSLPGPRLTFDHHGNLYGSTVGNDGFIGSIFELTSGGQFKVLYEFPDSSERLFTTGKLVLDSEGNIYGVDQTGGTFGEGAIFKLTPEGVYTVLYSFTGQGDGAFPNGVIRDKNGNLYGTANFGGAFNEGVVFEFTAAGNEQVLYSFTGGSDGGEPFDAALYRDAKGNLYGTTMFFGGIISNGVVFKLSPSGVETVLHTFTGGGDGARPKGSLVADSQGNLYGTTSTVARSNGGTVFKITPSGVKTELWTFTASADQDGYSPNPGLALDAEGNVYGTTFSGGSSNLGTVFGLTTAGAENVLLSFSGSNGSTPYSGLIFNQSGDLYGTTGFGGTDSQGTVFKLVP